MVPKHASPACYKLALASANATRHALISRLHVLLQSCVHLPPCPCPCPCFCIPLRDCSQGTPLLQVLQGLAAPGSSAHWLFRWLSRLLHTPCCLPCHPPCPWPAEQEPILRLSTSCQRCQPTCTAFSSTRRLGGKQVWIHEHKTCHVACCHQQLACRHQHLHLLHSVGGHDTEDDWDARIQASAEDAACGRAYYGVEMRRGAPHLQAKPKLCLKQVCARSFASCAVRLLGLCYSQCHKGSTKLLLDYNSESGKCFSTVPLHK